MSACAIMFGRIGIDPDIDALTRPTPMTAIMILRGVKKVSVDVDIRANGAYLSEYNETISHKNLFTQVTKQLKKQTNALLRSKYDADGCIWVDIQLTTKEETQFVAANISVSFAERMPWKRKPMWLQTTDTHFYGTTWQSRATLLVHKDKLNEEVPKCVRLLSDRFCAIFWGKQIYEETQSKTQKDKQ
jgi:hypothetical protein